MNDPDTTAPRGFATTHWSLVRAARPDERSRTLAREALAELCRLYWYPLYAFVRFRGHGPDEAQDLTQAFFTRLLEKGGLAGADPLKGRFRSYLLGSMKHFLANEWHRERTRKRGGGAQVIELDALDPEARFALIASEGSDPEAVFDREWALAILERSLERLRTEEDAASRGDQFVELKGCLTGDVPDRTGAGERLGLSPGALKVAVHRLRKRFRNVIRSEVAETVGSAADIDEEMRYLVRMLRSAQTNP